MLLCLMWSAACCPARQIEYVTRAELVRLEPPAVLLLNVPEPVLSAGTNRGLLLYALELRAALARANADKAALRIWAGMSGVASGDGDGREIFDGEDGADERRSLGE